MDAEFWHERWRKQEIGFHREQVHPQLAAHFHQLNDTARQRMFVPLCGKSVDMIWLCQQGAEVVGSELSALAIEAFAQENALELSPTEAGEHTLYAQSGLSLWQGDFFTLTPEQIQCTGFYDRAALVALPPSMREAYVAQLERVLAPNASGLVITFEYDSAEMSGPPFPISADEIQSLFAANWHIERLSFQDILAEHPGMQARGLTSLQESVWWLTRR